jgi:hypothetical protein
MKRTLIAILAVAATSPSSGRAEDNLVEFDRGIGVIPVSNVNAQGVGTANVVQGVPPGGQPWVIARLRRR